MQMFQHPLGRFDEYHGNIWNSRINFVSLHTNKKYTVGTVPIV